MTYRRVEYLESTGTQYIDTGVATSLNTEWYVDFSNFDGTGNSFAGLGGCGDNGCWINVSVAISNYNVSYASFGNIVDRSFNAKTVVGEYWNNGRHTIKISKDGVLMDDINTGVQFTGATFTPNNDTLCIFARKRNGVVTRYIKARLFNNEIRSNGTLVSHMIPCVRKSDSKPGTYDTVTNAFYTNAGTGEFIIPN